MSKDKSLSPSWSDVRMGARFLARLPVTLRRRWDRRTALSELEFRIRRRESKFLETVDLLIYKNPDSPYKVLLDRAGCAFGDLQRLTVREGVEGALTSLHKEGVYLTVEEFKGRKPAVRPGVTLAVTPERLRNPLSRTHVAMKSGGSRSRGTPVFFDLNFIRDCAMDSGLALHCRGGDDWHKATWEVPGGGALFSLLEFSLFGGPPVRWFSQLDPKKERLHPRYRWSGRALRLGARLAGRSMPGPSYVPLDDALPIALWMAGTLKKRDTPYLLTYASSALRVCDAAARHGIDLRGAQMTIAGEPCTPSRMKVIRNTGTTVLPKYAIMETGPVGYGCLAPEASDDLHLLSDLHAVIQPEDAVRPGPLARDSILFTSLRRTAPLVLLNVSMGDRASLVRRRCGCPLEGLGWDRHMHTIRSAEKLTCGGMNFIDSDIVRVLDELLPARFGGGPGDYQVQEEEGEAGDPGVRLLVRPRLGPLDEREVIEAFLEGISRGDDVQAVMGQAWRQGRIIRLERRDPLPTPSGKILHMHVSRAGRGQEVREGADEP